MFRWLRRLFVNWLTRDMGTEGIPLCDFDSLKHEVRTGDVLLVEGHSRISSVIKQLTKSPWSHCALYVGRIHDIEDPKVRAAVREYSQFSEETQLLVEGQMGEGIIVSPLSRYRGEHLRICRPKGLTHMDAQIVIGNVVSALGKPYRNRQILDLARFLLPWRIMPRRWGSSLFQPKGEEDGEICASLIANAFIKVDFPILPHLNADDTKGLALVHHNINLFTPRDFDYSPYFQIIKYPILKLDAKAIYHDLPWKEDEFQVKSKKNKTSASKDRLT